MKSSINILPVLFLSIFSYNTFAQQAGWGVTVENKAKKVKIGGRLQGIISSDTNNSSGEVSQDFYLRRVRVNLDYMPSEGNKFVFDIRNDEANYADKGESSFNIGDAYWQIDMNKYSIVNIRLFRAKTDVSYSQTSSSKNLFNPQRAQVSEHASDFVIHNRRAANIQANGQVANLTYQIVISDGVNSEDLEDPNGNSISSLNFQKFTYGAKLRYFFSGKTIIQDTFYGALNTFSIGLGQFNNDAINVTTNSAGTFSFARSMASVDISFSHNNFRLLAEHFSFKNDIVNANASTKNSFLGESSGEYFQLEYLFGKVAPYVIVEVWNKNSKQDNYVENVYTIGLNYYQNMEANRYGVAFKRFSKEKNIGNNDEEQVFAYLMLNF